MTRSPVSYRRHRFPPALVAHAVWLYFRFPLSLRLVEEMLLERGIIVSYETIRCWAKKFGPDYARRLRRKQPSSSDIWHLDEVVIAIAGRKHWLWRAVDQDGYVLDEIVQNRRNTKGCQTLACSSAEKTGRCANADDYRQAAILRRRKAPDHANPRAPFSQRVEQSSGKLASAAAKTGAGDANISIYWKPSTVPLSFLRGPQSLRAASDKTQRACTAPEPG
jgi:putative transposase